MGSLTDGIAAAVQGVTEAELAREHVVLFEDLDLPGEPGEIAVSLVRSGGQTFLQVSTYGDGRPVYEFAAWPPGPEAARAGATAAAAACEEIANADAG